MPVDFFIDLVEAKILNISDHIDYHTSITRSITTASHHQLGTTSPNFTSFVSTWIQPTNLLGDDSALD